VSETVNEAPTETSGEGGEAPGFWRRLFGPGEKGEKGEPAAADEGDEVGAGPALPVKNAPRPLRAAPRPGASKPQGKQDEEQQRRYARAAMLRRERLAKTIGEKVEQVVLDRMAEGEARLATAQEGFLERMGDVKDLLGAIGANLDEQVDQGARVTRILEGLPGATERERAALVQVAGAIERQGAGTQGGLAALQGLLAEVGRGLDAQGVRAERTARILEALPEVAGRAHEALAATHDTLDEHGRGIRAGVDAVHTALAGIARDLDQQGRQEREALEHVARALDDQGGTHLEVARAVSGLPEVVAIAREGRHAAEERLLALRGVKDELELQRDQRERLFEGRRQATLRFEERMVQLEARLEQGASQARADAGQLRLTLERSVGELTEQARGEAVREEQRTRRIEQGLSDVARKLGDTNALHAAGITAQGQALGRLQEAQGQLLDAFQRAQSRALGEVQRLHEEAQDKAEQVARRSRLALVASAGLVAIACVVGLTRPAPAPVVVVPQAATAPEAPGAASGAAGPRALPAGFRPEGAADGR
jgi:hypothetical protein